jgi:cardiolipin synthase C
VHAGYAKRRKALLKAGVKLYELRRLSGDSKANKGSGLAGSGSSGSASSLHAKTFSVDRARVFVGSFNLDLRSIDLNTELGFLIDSPPLAEQIASAFAIRIPANSYEVRLSESDHLYWVEHIDGQEVRHDKEPGTTFLRRAGVWFLSILPIEWLL